MTTEVKQKEKQTLMITMPPRNNVTSSRHRTRYHCCCGCVHCRTGTIIIAVLELVGVVLNGINSVVNYFLTSKDFDESPSLVPGKSLNVGSFGFSIAGMVITVVIIGLLFYAIASNKRYFVIPHLVYQLLGIAALLIGAVMSVCGLVAGDKVPYFDHQAIITGDGSDSSEEKPNPIYIITLEIILFASALIEVWFLYVVYKFYRYLKEKSSAYIRDMGTESCSL